MMKQTAGYQNVVLEPVDPAGVAIMRIMRPHTRNAINRATIEELEVRIGELEARSDVRCLIVAAETETTFIAGGDLKDFAELTTPEQGRAMGAQMQQVLHRLSVLPFPSIAAIGGNAYGGGCEVALACDLRVLAADAHLVFSQVRLGLTTGWGGGPRLVQMVGPAVAMRILLTGESVSANEAWRLGLAAAVVPREQVAETASELAHRIAALPHESVAALKQLIHRSVHLSLEDALVLENHLFGQRWGSAEHQAAVARFLTRKGLHES
ncbi:MAG: enoyl-CoA hydratase/isomerase family protein [Myxococcales bacterium]|nr:enoyl-CoA hydratase/isomerase family protein [Myxococcales bacterium]